ncbi:hypothetical protein L208DRAFT_1290434, partial [Tricholoma matsutake]
SMHAGGAMSLALNGVPPHLIQTIGHWASASFHIYIHKHPLLVHAMIAGHLPCPWPLLSHWCFAHIHWGDHALQQHTVMLFWHFFKCRRLLIPPHISRFHLACTHPLTHNLGELSLSTHSGLSTLHPFPCSSHFFTHLSF